MSDTDGKLPLPDLEKNAGAVMDATTTADAWPFAWRATAAARISSPPARRTPATRVLRLITSVTWALKRNSPPSASAAR